MEFTLPAGTSAELSEEFWSIYHLVERFAKAEIAPYVHDWDEAGEVPRAVHKRAAELGLLGLGYPEQYGGTPAPQLVKCALTLALSRYGASGGLNPSLMSHGIGLPPIVAFASETLKQRIIPPVLRGDEISALAITEPGGGSDVAALRCRAVRDGDHYVINGEKTFITSGMRADWITLAVRTGEVGSRGASGISVIAVPGDSPGLSRSPLKKMGWWCSDTAHLHFDNVRVPASFLVGQEGAGFKIIMNNFNAERLSMATSALGFAQACYDEALDWAKQRKTFGSPLSEKQVIRHKLMDMQMRLFSTQAWLMQACSSTANGPETVAQLCLLKVHATQTMQFCADQAVQILGGMGFMRGTRSERIYREVKVMMIGGGAEEIMKDLAARQLGV
jgi:acyl-CoA dehydrogenase